MPMLYVSIFIVDFNIYFMYVCLLQLISEWQFYYVEENKWLLLTITPGKRGSNQPTGVQNMLRLVLPENHCG